MQDKTKNMNQEFKVEMPVMETEVSLRSPLKTLGYIVLVVMTVAGLWSVAVTLIEGHLHANTTQHVAWGLWVAFYIYFLGLSAGSFLLSTLIYVFGVKQLDAAGPLSLVQALFCLLLGGFLIVMDLGHPLRVHNVLFSFNSSSVMSWMALFYIFYILIVVVELYLALRPRLIRCVKEERKPAWLYRLMTLGSTDLSQTSLFRDAKWLKILGIIGIPIAIIVHGGVGSIFAVAKARPNWFSGLFPIIFLISALASGGALLTFLVAAFFNHNKTQKKILVTNLARLTIGILCFDLLLLFADVFIAMYGGIPHDVAAWNMILFGPYAWVFWGVQIGLGTVIPIAIVLTPGCNTSIKWLGTAGFLVAFGIIGTRLNIVIPPQITPVFEQLPNTYHHARNALGYYPSMHEWLVGAFSFALGIWILLAALKYLPLESTEGERS